MLLPSFNSRKVLKALAERRPELLRDGRTLIINNGTKVVVNLTSRNPAIAHRREAEALHFVLSMLVQEGIPFSIHFDETFEVVTDFGQFDRLDSLADLL